MLDKLRKGAALLGAKWMAATQLPEPIAPKVKGNNTSYPSYLTNTKPPKTSIAVNDRQLAQTDIARIARSGGTRAIIKQLAHSSPALSASMFAYLRTGISKDYHAIAYNLDGTFNPDGTNLVQQLLVRFDILTDYSTGFSGTGSMRANSESLGKEMLMYGAMSGELILGKDRLPRRIQPISVTQIEFQPNGPDVLQPIQRVGGDVIDLNIPTFFYTSLDQTLTDAYPSSMYEAAIKPTFFSEQFMSDLTRVMRQAIHPRIKVTIDEDKFRKFAPPEAQHNQDETQTYLNAVLASIADQINNLGPEDALVIWDSVTVELLNNGNSSISREYDTVKGMADSNLATGAKTLPAILGQGAGSSNIASTESLIFMKNAEGAVQRPLNEFYSRILTLAVRLFGLDVYVKFWYDPIDLRPDSELEAFKQAKQSRVLELLSLGLVSDEQASIDLTGRLPPAGFKPLSGTMFKSAAADTNTGDGTSNNGSAANKNMKSDAPTQGRGTNNKNDPQRK